ncbi:unnamed protein product [Rhodiola kirilowii]
MNGRLLRSISLSDDMVKVLVNSALGQNVELPILHGETLKTARDAKGKSDLVAWPKDLVEINIREYTMQLYYYLPPAPTDEVDNYSADCRFLHDMWSNLGKNIVRVHIDDEVFGDDTTLPQWAKMASVIYMHYNRCRTHIAIYIHGNILVLSFSSFAAEGNTWEDNAQHLVEPTSTN